MQPLKANTDMKSKRRYHDSSFKARVPIEALKGEKMFHEIAKPPHQSHACHEVEKEALE
jgi:hypothetical protein